MARSSIIIDPERLVFAMDIGTRSIVGLVCHPENEKLRVLATETEYHPQRDMMDGQIHNIEGVVISAREVKKRLEKRLGITLKTVAVAAAGRALITRRSTIERSLEPGHRIKKEEVSSLELAAVEKVRETLLSESDSEKTADAYYCVGYSTVAYYLDDYPISSLIGQKGKKMGAEVLVTFLPQVVIDSLLTVVEELGLSVSNLTLEPIAAINVTIPPEYRSLNLALVDVGAGTSDIAITHKGAIVGYAMVPMAGDEITEQIAEAFLLDFNTAERVKLQSTQSQGRISFKDILGNSFNLSAEDIIKVTEPVVDKITSEIAAVIKKYNNGPTRAVFCIGGGSRAPLFREKLAEKLDLPVNMVATRGHEIVNQVIYKGKKLNGPESITPLGIAVSALQKNYFGFTYVTVNGKVIRLLETENLKVSNALVAAAFQSKKLLGRRGPNLRFFLNGEEKIIPGIPGEHARIMVNGKSASLGQIIKNNDKIEIIKATEGSAPVVHVKDLFPHDRYYIYFNEKLSPLFPEILVNGQKADPEQTINEGDRVEFKGMGTLGDFIKMAELDPDNINCLVNDQQCSMQHELKVGDRITVHLKRKTAAQKELPGQGQTAPAGHPDSIPPLKVRVNGQEIVLDGNKAPVFVDIFNYINFDRSKPRGKLVMKQNGQPASLTAKLADGDDIAIYWEKNNL